MVRHLSRAFEQPHQYVPWLQAAAYCITYFAVANDIHRLPRIRLPASLYRDDALRTHTATITTLRALSPRRWRVSLQHLQRRLRRVIPTRRLDAILLPTARGGRLPTLNMEEHHFSSYPTSSSHTRTPVMPHPHLPMLAYQRLHRRGYASHFLHLPGRATG